MFLLLQEEKSLFLCAFSERYVGGGRSPQEQLCFPLPFCLSLAQDVV